LYQLHQELSHAGPEQTAKTFSTTFSIPGSILEVTKLALKDCTICPLIKPKNNTQRGTIVGKTGIANSDVSIDLVDMGVGTKGS
jgi:hypothetical protein